MISEFALEPSLLNNWPSFRYFFERFGVPQGRLISRYPKAWKRLVYESLTSCGEIEKKRIVERLRTIDDRILKRPNSAWTDGQAWLSNAETEHQRKPFHAIIAATNPNNRAFVLDGNALDDRNATWGVGKSEVVERNAAAMASCIAPLLRASREMLFIDPHFDPQKIEYRNCLSGFLTVACDQREGVPIHRVEIHASDAEDKPSTELFQERCRQLLPALIPSGINVHIYRWRQRQGGEKLHNRYVLTDLGGVQFHVGLDEGNAGETDEVDLLEEKVYRLRLAQYDAAAPAFDHADDLVIAGTKA